MKKITITFLLICCFFLVSLGQEKNEQLYKAISKNDTALVAKLLKEKADPNYIITAGAFQMNMLSTAINTSKDFGIVKLLLQYKADPNWKDAFNSTPLMYAAAIGDKNLVSLLLEFGADITANDGKGNTVLSAAKESKNKDLIKFIEEKIEASKNKSRE